MKGGKQWSVLNICVIAKAPINSGLAMDAENFPVKTSLLSEFDSSMKIQAVGRGPVYACAVNAEIIYSVSCQT